MRTVLGFRNIYGYPWISTKNGVDMDMQGFIQRVVGGALDPPSHSSAPLEIK